MSEEEFIYAWLPKGQGPKSLGRTLGRQLDVILADFQKNPSEDATIKGMMVLAELIRYAGPLLAHRRKCLADEALKGGCDIDEWTGRDLEADPEMMHAARQVAAQMLHLFPGIMPPAVDLPSNLLTLNNGQARPFLTPSKRKKGGASQAELDRIAALRAMFWMRVGFDGVQKSEMVRKFTDLTGLSARTIERIAGKTSAVSEPYKSVGESRRAGEPDPVYCPVSIPTDDHIRQVAEHFKD